MGPFRNIGHAGREGWLRASRQWTAVLPALGMLLTRSAAVWEWAGSPIFCICRKRVGNAPETRQKRDGNAAETRRHDGA